MPLSRLWWPLLDRRWGWLIPLIMVANLLLLILVPAWRSTCLELAAAFTRWSFPGAHWTTHLVVFLISAVVLSLGPFVFASSFWVLYGSRDLLAGGA